MIILLPIMIKTNQTNKLNLNMKWDPTLTSTWNNHTVSYGKKKIIQVEGAMQSLKQSKTAKAKLVIKL